MKIIFISDLHLSPNTLNNNQLFLSLMQQWEHKISVLYILGDFFDYWLGDDDKNDFTDEIKACFKQFTQHTPIYFIRGNHDFGLGKRFSQETGITILKDCSVLQVQDKRILLSHGDIFCTLDINYQKMKKILQNPVVMYILRKIPLSWRYKIKNKLEKKSTDSYNPRQSHIYKVVNSTIAEYAEKLNVDTVIHGHTHDPDYYLVNLGNGVTIQRIEIPDWVGRPPGGYVVLDNGKFTIINNERLK